MGSVLELLSGHGLSLVQFEVDIMRVHIQLEINYFSMIFASKHSVIQMRRRAEFGLGNPQVLHNGTINNYT